MIHHDVWVKLRDSHREMLEQTGLPERIWARQTRLVRFLASGKVEEESQGIDDSAEKPPLTTRNY
jgi:hypothetical protein